MVEQMNRYPRISIEFCTKCKWNLRAAWYLQELLSTFGADLGEVALQPSGDGRFVVTLVQGESDKPIVLWDRKEKGGFPDSKELKRLVRDQIQPDRNLGHVDRQKPAEGLISDQPATTTNTTTCEDCV